VSDYYAHTKQQNSGRLSWHRLEDHLRRTAEVAKSFASAWDAGDWGYWSGLWHDIGKYSNDFQNMLRAVSGEDAHLESPSRVDHSTAGAKHAASALERVSGKAVAYVIAGHHGGLPDGESVESCLRSRLEKRIPSADNCPPELLGPGSLTLPPTFQQERLPFQYSTFIRMLFSCLVDADFLDTEAFMDPRKASQRQGYMSIAEIEPVFFDKLRVLRENSRNSPVNDQREQVLEQCLAASEERPGLFSLTVPTGGGKTLSSMAFALRHALTYGLRRIIYAIPFTSIIEQNAEVFRAMLDPDVVVEHHSNFEPAQEHNRSRLASENWDAPIIVTTNVQFFKSLFANKPGRCRKLHNIARSVVILDEVQALPSHVLLPCLEMLKELTITYHCSIVLCSATQPAVQRREDFTSGLQGVTEIIDDPTTLAAQMKRTRISVRTQLRDRDLIGDLLRHSQVLCIVNTRRHARALFERLSHYDGSFHLSALMCPVHRSAVLRGIRERLTCVQTCRVISTQLIEAGVDIDFPVVFRAVAGIDSIAQSAGRCNREGHSRMGTVYVFSPEDGIPPGHLRQTAQAAESIIHSYSASEILSIEAIEEYFKHYYWSKGAALDENDILGMIESGRQYGDIPFKTVAERFRLIAEGMKPVIIPFDDSARQLIEKLEYEVRPV
jgi:CRISPR-associated endonuclease/helicase Cas3